MLGLHYRPAVQRAGRSFATGSCVRSAGDTIIYIRRTTISATFALISHDQIQFPEDPRRRRRRTAARPAVALPERAGLPGDRHSRFLPARPQVAARSAASARAGPDAAG